MGDAIRLFRRNRLAVWGLAVILFFFFMAISAPFWTYVGLIDQKSGFASVHIVNPPGLERVDPLQTPAPVLGKG
ncbi:MAG: hypothetical protein HC915_15850 [Anaerolineae bacterium]|nr:hypothetical protein [Anaerolineae bacterium]